MESNNKKATSQNTINTEIKKGFIPAHVFNILQLIFCDRVFSDSSKTANMFHVRIFKQ